VWPQEEVAAHGVVDGEPRDKPRDVLRHPDAWCRRSSQRRAARRAARLAEAPGPAAYEPAQGKVVDNEPA
jgi:hypothetical protein